jgi:hypothetical protein
LSLVRDTSIEGIGECQPGFLAGRRDLGLTEYVYIDILCDMMGERKWSTRELRAELDRYEAELRAANLARNTVMTYVQHPERFIKWLDGEIEITPR